MNAVICGAVMAAISCFQQSIAQCCDLDLFPIPSRRPTRLKEAWPLMKDDLGAVAQLLWTQQSPCLSFTDAVHAVVPPACRAACRHCLRLVLQRRVRNILLEEVLQMRVVVKVIRHDSRERLDYQKILCNGTHSHIQCVNENAVGSTNRRKRLREEPSLPPNAARVSVEQWQLERRQILNSDNPEPILGASVCLV